MSLESIAEGIKGVSEDIENCMPEELIDDERLDDFWDFVKELRTLSARLENRVEEIRNGSTPISSRRVTAPAASFVCNVLSTR